MTLVVASPIGGAELWAAAVSFGYSEGLRALSHEMEISHVVGFSDDVVRARNRCAARVLRDLPDATHVLWWDVDNYPEDLKIVKALIDTGEDLVGAPYTNKRQPARWVHQPLPHQNPFTGSVAYVRAVGFGFTMTTRACLERMFRAERRYRDWPGELIVSNMFGQLFEAPDPDSKTYCPLDQEALRSEDYSFCKRWRDLGGKVALYTGAGVIYHAGQHAWSGKEIA